MPKITEISPLRFKKDYCTIVFSEGQSFRLHQDLLHHYGLAKDQDLTQERIAQIQFESQAHEAKEYSYLFLSYRARSEKEMFDRLKRKGFSADVISQVIHHLKSQNLLNDSELARNLADSRLRNRLWSKNRIRQDLIQKGIEPQVAEEIVNESEAEVKSEVGSEEERAYKLLLKRKEQLKSIDAHTLYRRLFSYLARRGFSFDLVEKVLGRFKREENLKKEKS